MSGGAVGPARQLGGGAPGQAKAGGSNKVSRLFEIYYRNCNETVEQSLENVVYRSLGGGNARPRSTRCRAVSLPQLPVVWISTMRSHRRQETRRTWRGISKRRRFWMGTPGLAFGDGVRQHGVPVCVRHRIARTGGRRRRTANPGVFPSRAKGIAPVSGLFNPSRRGLHPAGLSPRRGPAFRLEIANRRIFGLPWRRPLSVMSIKNIKRTSESSRNL